MQTSAMKVGDIVRFLNDVGGGRISRIDSGKKLVYVEDADGFEIPVLAQEVVIVDQGQAQTPQEKSAAQMGARPYSSAASAKTQHIATPDSNTQIKNTANRLATEVYETPEGDTLRLFLAFVPDDIRQLQTTETECLLINDSNYFVYYNIARITTHDAYSVAAGMIEPNMQETLTYIAKDQLNDWEQLHIQAIAFKTQKRYQCQRVIDYSLRLNPVRFYKLHAYQENEYLDEHAILVDLIEEANRQQLHDIDANALREAMMQKDPPKAIKPQKATKERRSDIIEVDLHIGQLLDTTVGMSNTEMLNYQMDTFHKVMQRQMSHKGQKIIFIHGKGEGVLRHEIEKALKTRYKQCSYQDASFREYGFGATQVIIH
ncbi:MAG: DUF2027 domain-containing protein [Paludibacteraceae bacterium]|nr:DUF2027 domain-containing protein [Paludibacteraceae bacterium]